MSQNSEFFFRNAGRVAWIMKWKMYGKMLFITALLGLCALEGIVYVVTTH